MEKYNDLVELELSLIENRLLFGNGKLFIPRDLLILE